MASYRSRPDTKGNPGLKFIESLIKNKFSMYETDSEGKTPLNYLLLESVPAPIVFNVIQIAMKYGFDVVKNGSGEEDDADEEVDLTKTFMMELFTAGKMTLKLFKLIEPMIKKLSLSKI